MEKKCIALSSIGAAMNCVDTDNGAGICDYILFGFADEVGTWPRLPAPKGDGMLSLEEAGAWDGDIAMENGCHLYEFHFTDESGELKITEQGEKGGKSYLYELDLSRAKMNALMFGFENAIKDRKLVIIARDRNGVYYLMGDENAPAMKVDGDGSATGKANSDRNGTSFKFQYSCPRKLVYTGEIKSLVKSTDDFYGYESIGTDDYTDTSRFVVVNIGTQIHSTGNTDTELYFPIENLSSLEDLYVGVSDIAVSGKIPVLQAVLQVGTRNIDILVPLHQDGENFVGTDMMESGHYVSVEITPFIASSMIFIDINENE